MLQGLTLKNFRIIVATAAIILFVLFFYFLYLPVYAVNEEFTVNDGETLSHIAARLKSENLIKNEFVFVFYVKALGLEKELKAGKYIFNGFMSVPKIVSLFGGGFAESNDIRVVIPEGYNVLEIDQVLAEAGVSAAGDFTGQFYRDEGFLFPDSYRFKKGEDASQFSRIEASRQAGKKMKDNFRVKTADVLLGLSENKKRETIIIASILEKEARTEEDMHLISGIIEKRMAAGMLLQIDATVNYGACLWKLEEELKDLKFKSLKHCAVSQIGVGEEIKIDGPYNTYTRAGLPPGPISNPGITAIKAALNPLASGYFYYLSTRDGASIIFSKTAEEHAQNRKKYLGI